MPAVSAQTPDKRLLWHPRNENKFVVGGGTDITLYEWAPDQPEIRHVTSQHDLQFMKCFAWSPDSSLDDLIAIGLSTGRVDLLRLEATKYARNNVLSSGPTVSLPVRSSRACNSLAFCHADPNYLAVGLDKVRGDSSLVIWDLQSSLPALSLPSQATTIVEQDSLLGSRPHPCIPRGDVGSKADSRILQQHATTEIVSALSFLPNSTHLLLAGISLRWLRLFDLRSHSPSTANVASRVHGIVTDPFDPHRIACFGDGNITVWDGRRLQNPLITFSERDAYADGARRRANSVFTGIEFSSTRRGTLASLEKDSTYVRFWDLLQVQSFRRSNSSDGEVSRDYSRSNRLPKRSWTNLPWTSAPSASQESPLEDPQASISAHILADTRRTRNFSKPLTSFTLVPSAEMHTLTSNVMVVNSSGDLEVYAVHDTPKQAPWSSRGELAIGSGQTYRMIKGFRESEPPPEPWDVPLTPNPHPSGSIARSDIAREESVIRGRGKRNNIAPFGRGDGDDFPALGSDSGKDPANLATIRLGKGRTYSPAAFKNHNFERSAERSVGEDLKGGVVDRSAPPREIFRARSRRSLREKSASCSRKPATRAIQQVVEEDISMVMRSRVIRGYGLNNPPHNVHVTRDDSSDETTLSELWAWIKNAREVLFVPTPRIHGYDFSYQGLLGIWEGFSQQQLSTSSTPTGGPPEPLPAAPQSGGYAIPTRSRRCPLSPSDDIHGDFHSAVASLCTRRGDDLSLWKPLVPTHKLEQRQFALQLCGWSLKEGDLSKAIKRWEKEGKFSRAACWLVFTTQYSKAVELLMRSKNESHNMMSGTLAALVPTGSGGLARSSDLREQCERLIVRLQDPYFRAMLAHLASGDWSEVLEEESLPLRERLAIAFQFVEDKALTSYLRRTAERAGSRGDLGGLIVTGLTPAGMNILQNYVDRTGDIQTAAILSSYVCPARFSDVRVDHWLEAYRDLLDGFKLFHHRVAFDIDRGQINQEAIHNGDVAPFEWAPRQIIIRCNYCSKAISVPGTQKTRASACPHCGRALPRCSVCLMTLSIVRDDERNYELLRSQHKDTIEDAIVLCQTCRHGGHASHILDWFFGQDGAQSHKACPVADCNCRCSEEF